MIQQPTKKQKKKQKATRKQEEKEKQKQKVKDEKQMIEFKYASVPVISENSQSINTDHAKLPQLLEKCKQILKQDLELTLVGWTVNIPKTISLVEILKRQYMGKLEQVNKLGKDCKGRAGIQIRLKKQNNP